MNVFSVHESCKIVKRHVGCRVTFCMPKKFPNVLSRQYTVEVTNRFKGLDLIEYLKICGQRFVTLYRRQGSKTSARKRNAKRQNGCLRKPYK